MIERVLEGLCQIFRIAVGCLVAALIIPVTMQVLARYTGIIPTFLWTEELATFLFVWMVMLGSIVAVWEGTHFDVHVVPEAKSRAGQIAATRHCSGADVHLCHTVCLLRSRLRKIRRHADIHHAAGQYAGHLYRGPYLGILLGDLHVFSILAGRPGIQARHG